MVDIKVFQTPVQNRVNFINKSILDDNGNRREGWRLATEDNQVVVDSQNFNFLIQTKNFLMAKKKLTV